MDLDNEESAISALPEIRRDLFASLIGLHTKIETLQFLFSPPFGPAKSNYDDFSKFLFGAEVFAGIVLLRISFLDRDWMLSRAFDELDLYNWANSSFIKTFLWTEAIIQEASFPSLRYSSKKKYQIIDLEDYNLSQKIPGFRFKSFGLFRHLNGASGFGVILNSSYNIETAQWKDGYFQEEIDGVPKFIDVLGHKFPVVIRRLQENLHSSVSSPKGGLGACYAKSKVSNQVIGPGILTAKHVVGQNLGTAIHLTCSCRGKVIDVAPDGIDAALVSCQCSSGTNKQIFPLKMVAPWMDVQFVDSLSRIIKTKVTSITDTRGIFGSSALPARVFIAIAGNPGDSGALITEVNTNKPVGIYMGSFVDAAGQAGGLAQHALQITEIMDMELYI